MVGVPASVKFRYRNLSVQMPAMTVCDSPRSSPPCDTRIECDSRYVAAYGASCRVAGFQAVVVSLIMSGFFSMKDAGAEALVVNSPAARKPLSKPRE